MTPILSSTRLDGPFDGIELATVEWGDPAARRVVLCVHGLTRNARDFDALAAALAEAGARVVAVDVAGRGRSSRLADPRGYTVAGYAAHLARFCALRGLEKVDWIGTSMGGIIGMVLAAQGSAAIGRLVLNDVGPFIDASALAQIASYVGLDLRFDSIEALERHLRAIHAGFGPLTDPQWRHLATHSARPDGEWYRLHYDPAIRLAHAEGARNDIDLWPLWELIHCPSFVLRGADSRILSAATAKRMGTTGPKAEVATFAGIGHAPSLMAADQIAAIRTWLGLAG